MTNNPVTILVIGNGFDLSLKLPTSYGDFLKFADYMRYYSSEGHTYDVEKNRSFQVDKRIGQLIDQYSGKVADNLSSRRAEIGEACQNNFWIEYFIKKQTELNSKGRNRWVDFETEITRIIAVLENDLLNSEEGYEGELNTYNNEEIDEFFDEHEEIRHDTFSDIHDRLLTDLNKLTWLLGFYLCLFVENIKDVAPDPIVSMVPNVIKEIVERAEDLRVINFNYTHSIANYLRSIGKPVEIDYIHGYADAFVPVGTGNMILGASLDGGDKTSVDFIDFRKYFQRILKGTDHKYMDWVEEINRRALKQAEVAKRNQKLVDDSGGEKANILELARNDKSGHFYTRMPEPNHVYFFGHSMDETDGDVIKRLVLAENTATTVYCYAESEHDHKDMAQKIKNMQKIIGRDELIRRTGSSLRAGIEFVNLY